MNPFKLLILISILSSSIVTSSVPQQSQPSKKLDNNKEYRCVRWVGSADYSQKQPTVCLKWEVRENRSTGGVK